MMGRLTCSLLTSHTHTHSLFRKVFHCACVSQVRRGLQSHDQGQLTLDVLSLAELQRLGVPPTDDRLKYRYHLQGDTYGKVRRVS